MLDTLAKRYGKLPTEVLRKGDSFDLSVMDVALTYEKYQRDKDSGSIDEKMYDMDALKQAADKAKENHENRQQNISKKDEST
jgi:hypothetical protein|tara:strand:- start:179 stop:424 length:246 start_codon:yes stop_codon:yes gene_type:complete